MTIIILSWLALTLLEAYRNYYLIEKKKVDIDHDEQTVYRVIVGLLFWLVSAHALGVNAAEGIAIIIMMIFTFWFVFDISLNLMRDKPIFYFGQGSKLDRIEAQFPLPAVFFKALLAGASITLLYHL